MSTAEEFWRFSLRVYARAEVEATCLGLQDQRGCDVNLLLLACWLGTRGVRLTSERRRTAEAAIRPWREQAVVRLRAVRRDLKPWVEDIRQPDAVREAIYRLRLRIEEDELQAEKILQTILVSVAAGWPEDGRAGASLVRENLLCVHDFSGMEDALHTLLGASASEQGQRRFDDDATRQERRSKHHR